MFTNTQITSDSFRIVVATNTRDNTANTQTPEPAASSGSTTISLITNAGELNEDSKEIYYCIGEGCDPLVNTSIATSATRSGTSPFRYTAVIPMQATGTVVRWAGALNPNRLETFSNIY